MPTPKPIHRTYCKTCNNFTIHQWTSEEDLNCINCGTKEIGYNINDVNAELIKEQRAKYSKRKRANLLNIYGMFLIDGIINSNYLDIIECPAGQDQIDEQSKLKLQEYKRLKQEKLDDYNNNYKHLGRNEPCACGSNKKYKHCHFKEFN